MSAFFFVNAMQVDFESVLAMEHTGMAKMFKYLEDTRLKVFLEASGSVYEAAVVEFFANEKVIAGMIVSFVGNRKLALTKDVFAETFGLPTEGLAPNKNNEMKMEYLLLHDIVAKPLCAKAGSFDVVTSEKFDLMVAISDGFKVNWAQVLNNKSVHTYIKKNLNAVPTGESSKETKDTASGTAGGQSQMTKTVEKGVETAVGKNKKKTEKVVPAVKKMKVVVSKRVEAGAKMLQRGPRLRPAQTWIRAHCLG
ncbi:hypothetical protein F511_43031 [Dorcoceras hygrometricum]|uniref:Uncharacterized protein n=1 Tax=Dorcoceras hygrometricum TaxID=472368 RepID=A0A2Z7A7D2_9LAMI|nr:hypothetical protein F511_43031 [Dorcoceras hygrometricum]